MQVPGAQVAEAERRFIRDLATCYNEPSAIIVNIGVMWGCTMWCLRDGAPQAQLCGVDIAPESFVIENEKGLDAMIIKGDSRTLAFPAPVALLLIDGGHHYETVRADIANWLPRVTGAVVFHDYAPAWYNLQLFPHIEGVRRAVDEWRAANPGWLDLGAPDSLKAFRLK
jgi:trans-aconitate methyltransferase